MFIIFTYTSNIFHKEVQVNYNKSHVISQKQKIHTVMRIIKLDTVAVTEVEVPVNFRVERGKWDNSHVSNRRKSCRSSHSQNLSPASLAPLQCVP